MSVFIVKYYYPLVYQCWLVRIVALLYISLVGKNHCPLVCQCVLVGIIALLYITVCFYSLDGEML